MLLFVGWHARKDNLSDLWLKPGCQAFNIPFDIGRK